MAAVGIGYVTPRVVGYVSAEDMGYVCNGKGYKIRSD